VNGKLILESGRLVGADEETIRKNADRASRRLLEKAALV
jgi:hypothetical protein